MQGPNIQGWQCACGARNVAGAGFCHHCGAPRAAPAPATGSVAPRPAVAGAPAAPPAALTAYPADQRRRCWGWFWKSFAIGFFCTGIISLMIGLIQAFSPVPEDRELAGYTFAGMVGATLLQTLVMVAIYGAVLATFLSSFMHGLTGGGGSPLSPGGLDLNAPLGGGF